MTSGIERFSSGTTYGERTTKKEHFLWNQRMLELEETLGTFTKGTEPGGEVGALTEGCSHAEARARGLSEQGVKTQLGTNQEPPEWI